MRLARSLLHAGRWGLTLPARFVRALTRPLRSAAAAAAAYGLRSIVAYVCMSAFVTGSTVGAAMIYPPAGWITFAAASGFVGYLLGKS